MISKIRNIIIFIAIAAIFVLIYLYFIKSPKTENNLVSSTPVSLPNVDGSVGSSAMIDTTLETKDFLTLLLSVKNIKLEDSIFASTAFMSLRDSSITLTPDGNEGRPNPFAQFGNDTVISVSGTPDLPISVVPPTNP